MWLKHRVRIGSDARGIVADSHYVLSLRTYNRTQNYGVDPWSNNVHVCPTSCGVHVPRSDSRGYSDAELSVRRETMDHRSRGVFRVFRVTLVSVLRQQSQRRQGTERLPSVAGRVNVHLQPYRLYWGWGSIPFPRATAMQKLYRGLQPEK